jgi:hypothetical protein
MTILLTKKGSGMVLSLPGFPVMAFDAGHGKSSAREKDLLEAMAPDAIRQLREARDEVIPKPDATAQRIAASIMSEELGTHTTLMSDRCVLPNYGELFTGQKRPEGAYEGASYAARLFLKNGDVKKALRILSNMVDCYIMGFDPSANEITAREAIPLALKIARPWVIAYGSFFSGLPTDEFDEFKGGVDGMLQPREAIMLLGLVGDLRDQIALSRCGNGAFHSNIEQYCSGAMEKIRARTAFRLAHYLMDEETLAHFGMADGTPFERIDNNIAHVLIQFGLVGLMDAFPIFSFFGPSTCGPIAGEMRRDDLNDLLRDGLSEPITLSRNHLRADGPEGWRMDMAMTYCLDRGILVSVPEPKPSRVALTDKGKDLMKRIFEAIATARVVEIQTEEKG